MLKQTKSWYKGLGKAGKSVVWLATVFISLMGIGAAAGTPPAQTPTASITTQAAPKTSEHTPTVEVKDISETTPVPFDKTSVQTSNLAQGTSKITTAGVNGLKTITYSVTYKDGAESSRVIKSEAVTTPPVTEVTSVGTYVAPAPTSTSATNCDPNYKPCIPYVSYDLDCKDIGKRVTVVGTDHYRLDADHDGMGCESY